MKLTGGLIVLLTCAILGNGQESVSFLEPNCGVSTPRARNSRSRQSSSRISSSRKSKYRIVGGVPADEFGNPWMTFIRSNVHCGGSLITARFVLSAAHCMTGHPTTASFGEYDTARSSPNVIQIPVDLQIPHPQYTNSRRDIKNDIGLFRLARTVQYTDFIRPVCLPTNYNPLARTTQLTATGWGKTEYGVASNVLKTTTLTQLNRGTCSSTFNSNVDISQICAGAPDSHTCSGDSGGPITAKYPIGGRSRVLQLGIVSYGEQFCRTVGVYTNVMHYMSWITNVVRRGGVGVGGQQAPTPTQRPNHNTNNNYYIDTRSPPILNSPNPNPPGSYYLNNYYPTYQYPNSGNSGYYYLPNGYTPGYSYPQNYVVYG